MPPASAPLLVSINLHGLSEAQRKAVLKETFSYALKSYTIDEIELEPAFMSKASDAAELALRDLVERGRKLRGRTRVLHPDATDLELAHVVAPYIMSLHLKRQGDFVLSASDELSDIDLVVKERSDWQSSLDRLATEIGSFDYELAELAT